MKKVSIFLWVGGGGGREKFCKKLLSFSVSDNSSHQNYYQRIKYVALIIFVFNENI